MNLEELKGKYDIKIDELEDFTRVQVREDERAEFYQDLVECIKNCNSRITIANGIMGNASKEEFLQGEEIIKKVLEEISPDWSDKQKVAFVHYKMGELVSYIPDFNFNGMYANSQATTDSRNIWKSLVTGTSVCNGITSIARNIMARKGINTKELDSGTHSFILAEVEEGNIIIDPTWDLRKSLYGARPMYFGKTYEQIRSIETELSNAHKLESSPENVLEISDEELREIYYSLGYTKQDRTFIFPILDMVNQVNSKTYDNFEEKLGVFFTMFTQKFSNEATHLSETRTILEECMYEFGIEPKDLITKFVYAKSDNECINPYLSLFINNKHIRNKIKILDAKTGQFIDTDLVEFDKEYKIHELDTTEPFWKKYLQESERQDSEMHR